MKNLVCPISSERIAEHTCRLNALFVMIFLIAYSISGNLIIPMFLLLDFFSRSFLNGKYSLLAYFSKRISFFFQLKSKLVDKAPKVFAARLGFLFSIILFILALTNFTVATFVVSLLFGFCAFLEFMFSFCVGCVIYTYINEPIRKFINLAE